MFRFNLSRVIPLVVALTFMASGCSQRASEPPKADPIANPPVSSYQEQRWEGQRDYLKCPDGASMRLMFKWLQVPHEATLPDSCMTLADATTLVGQKLPGIKAFIDKTNAKIQSDWESFQTEIDKTMQLPPNVAVRTLLNLQCHDKSVDALENAKRRWTPFLGTTPAEVRAAVDRIATIDNEGYGVTTINAMDNDGKTTKEVYDSYWYERTTKEAPMYEDKEKGYTQLPDSEIYGSYGNMPYDTLLQSFYNGMRVRATDAAGMPYYYESGVPLCMQ